MLLRTGNSRCVAVNFAIILILILVSLFSGFVSASVRINEIMAKTPKANYGGNCEWLELYSDGGDAAEIKNWKIDTGSQIVNFSYSLKDFLIITKNKTVFLENWNVEENKVIELAKIALNDNGDNITLFNSNSEVVSRFTYSSSHQNKSWQFFDNEWKECKETPAQENFCETAETTQQENEQQNQQPTESQEKEQENKETTEEVTGTQAKEKSETEIKTEVKDEPITQVSEENVSDKTEISTIKLNEPETKDIKNTKTTLYVSKNEKIKAYAIYGFSVFCLLAALVFLLKLRNK